MRFLPFNTPIVLCIGLLSVGAARGADSTPGDHTAEKREGPISLRAAIAFTLERHPNTKDSQLQVEGADSSIGLTYAAGLPTLNASASVIESQDSLILGVPRFGGNTYNTYQFGFEFNQPLYRAGALIAGVRAARQELELQKLSQGETARDLEVMVIKSFFGLLLAKRRLQAMDQTLKIQESLLETATRRYRIGSEQLLSVLQIKTNLALLDPQIADARNLLNSASAELASLIGWKGSAPPEVKGDLANPKIVSVLKSRLESATVAESKRSEILRVQILQEQLENIKKVQMSQHWPRLDLFGSWNRLASQKSDLLDNDASAWNVGLRLQIPLFSGLSSIHSRRILAAKVAGARVAEERLSDAVALAQIHARQNLELAVILIASSQKAQEQAAEAVRVAASSYRLGTASYLQVSEAQRRLTDAELALAQARYRATELLTTFYVEKGLLVSELSGELNQP